mmetsp:Transcript_26040/g.68823  ORF Transcript_26040/g.68823 Transcript_26040/m.68823 type:complete len:111 (-) Transcript_26040:124-456(-)
MAEMFQMAMQGNANLASAVHSLRRGRADAPGASAHFEHAKWENFATETKSMYKMMVQGSFGPSGESCWDIMHREFPDGSVPRPLGGLPASVLLSTQAAAAMGPGFLALMN